MKTASEILKLREAAKKEGEERIESLRTKEATLREAAKSEGIKFAEEVDLDPYIEKLIRSTSITIDISKFVKDYDNYTKYTLLNRIYELAALEAGVIEGLTKRFNENGFKFKHCKSFSGLIYELSI